MATEITPPQLEWHDARKRRADLGALWRAGAWGGAAAIALAALALTTQTDIGSERLQLVFADEPPAAAPLPPPQPQGVAEAKRLEAQLAALAADRDRLNARIAGLERNLDDATGSIKKQVAQVAAAAAEKPATSPPQPAAPAIAPLAMHVTAEATAPWSGVAPQPTPVAAAPPAAAPIAPSPAPAPAATQAPEAVPLPPARVASAAPSAAIPEPPRKPEIGIDLGGARNYDVLNARWVAVKANFGPLLGGLHPLAAHDPRPGMPEYRLLVGPLPTNAAAAQLCARFAAVRVTCRPTKFDGEQLAQR